MASSPESQIYPPFEPAGTDNARDVVLRKARYYAGDANALQEVLRVAGVDTAVIVFPSLSHSLSISLVISLRELTMGDVDKVYV